MSSMNSLVTKQYIADHASSTLHGLTDVELTAEADEDMLIYDTSISQWVNTSNFNCGGF